LIIMAKAQFPIDGTPAKSWKVTSAFGWRVHPVKKTKKHHNGVDLWAGAEPCYIESAYDGKVITAGPSNKKKADGEPDGFGYYVTVLSQVDGIWVTNLYAHMAKDSLKVKVGQKIEAGTVLGKMGATGMVTGKHLHWETWKGKTHGWSADGSGFLDPIEFCKAVIAKEKAVANAPLATPEDVLAAPTVTKEKAPVTKASLSADVKAKPSTTPAAAATASVHKVVSGDTLGRIAAFYKTTVDVLVKLNGIKDPNKIKVGQTIKLP
jgi:murein DD-endopeptidase MepM/ murein hydrolase activator NlpD